MNWKEILKSELDSVQEAELSIKPEETDRNCLRILKNLLKNVRRFAKANTKNSMGSNSYTIYADVLEPKNEEENLPDIFPIFMLNTQGIDKMTEEDACEILDIMNEKLSTDDRFIRVQPYLHYNLNPMLTPKKNKSNYFHKLIYIPNPYETGFVSRLSFGTPSSQILSLEMSVFSKAKKGEDPKQMAELERYKEKFANLIRRSLK